MTDLAVAMLALGTALGPPRSAVAQDALTEEFKGLLSAQYAAVALIPAHPNGRRPGVKLIAISLHVARAPGDVDPARRRECAGRCAADLTTNESGK